MINNDQQIEVIRMAKRDEGITKRKSGYQVRVCLGRDSSGKQLFSTGTAPTKEEARILRDELLRKAGRLKLKMDMTLDEYVPIWLDHLRSRDRSPGTVSGYESLFRLYASGVLGTKALRRITALDIDTVITMMAKKGLSAGTQRHMRAAFSSAFSQAKRWQLVSFNPVQDSTPPTTRRYRPPHVDKLDVPKILECAFARSPETGILVLLAAVTGGRRGELIAFRWRDLEWLETPDGGERCALHFAENRVRGEKPRAGGHRPVITKTTKSDDGRRLVLDSTAAAALRYQQNRYTRRVGGSLAPSAYVISPSWDCAVPYTPDWASHQWDVVRRAAGVPTVQLRHLRHHCATYLHEQGVDPITLCQWMGHSDPSIAQRFYIGARRMETATEAMGRLIEGVRFGETG